MQGKELIHHSTGVIPGAILDQDDVLLGLGQDLGQKVSIGAAGEALSLTLPEEATGTVIDQAHDLISLAFTTGFDEWLLTLWCPGVTQGAPLGETRFIAKESRSFVVSVSGFMTKQDFPEDTPHLRAIIENAPAILANGGSCISDPDGNWIVSPVTDREELIVATIDFNRVLEERQNFDPAGHYSRPDITKLTINRERQSILDVND